MCFCARSVNLEALALMWLQGMVSGCTNAAVLTGLCSLDILGGMRCLAVRLLRLRAFVAVELIGSCGGRRHGCPAVWLTLIKALLKPHNMCRHDLRTARRHKAVCRAAAGIRRSCGAAFCCALLHRRPAAAIQSIQSTQRMARPLLLPAQGSDKLRCRILADLWGFLALCHGRICPRIPFRWGHPSLCRGIDVLLMLP